MRHHGDSGEKNGTIARGDATEIKGVNGDIAISTSQLVAGTTVNGSISTIIGLPDWDRDLAFTTVNGSITTDIPVTIVSPGDIRGILGAGGRTLLLATVNGSVELDSGS